ncbi:hypothetical protein DPMN_059589 [Dreissena polymorpha]|uniref:Uncharacterized protein n=1 Tax=Dreissena polymorpha TaxID=45954 RepID=A0A9D4C3R7_DREPO|nr:hypothetical protein DPMN_059589 [Dreissena polymorpha]
MRHLMLKYEKKSGGGSGPPPTGLGILPPIPNPFRHPNVNLLPTPLAMVQL